MELPNGFLLLNKKPFAKVNSRQQITAGNFNWNATEQGARNPDRGCF